MAEPRHLEQLSKRLADDGRLIEAGWVSLRLHVIPLDVSALQLDVMHCAYMAGAQHLFTIIGTILDPGDDVTESDVNRMNLIHQELTAYTREMELRAAPPAGNA